MGSSNAYINDLIRAIYLRLQELRASMRIYWISTTLMLADKESRMIIFSEEYVPDAWYRCIIKRIGLRPTIDVMATHENAKCNDYIYFYSSPLDTSRKRDFFTHTQLLDHQVGYCFPPKKLLTQALNHIYNHFRHMSWIVVFHRFREWPLGLEQFRELPNATLLTAPQDMFTVIPSERKMIRQGIEYIGMPNKWAKATHILVYYANHKMTTS